MCFTSSFGECVKQQCLYSKSSIKRKMQSIMQEKSLKRNRTKRWGQRRNQINLIELIYDFYNIYYSFYFLVSRWAEIICSLVEWAASACDFNDKIIHHQQIHRH